MLEDEVPNIGHGTDHVEQESCVQTKRARATKLPDGRRPRPKMPNGYISGSRSTATCQFDGRHSTGSRGALAQAKACLSILEDVLGEDPGHWLTRAMAQTDHRGRGWACTAEVRLLLALAGAPKRSVKKRPADSLEARTTRVLANVLWPSTTESSPTFPRTPLRGRASLARGITPEPSTSRTGISGSPTAGVQPAGRLVSSRSRGHTTCATASPRYCFAEGRTHTYVALQMGHSTTVLISTYEHLIEEYADETRINAEAEIAKARKILVAPRLPRSPPAIRSLNTKTPVEARGFGSTATGIRIRSRRRV